jgi:hypothetical protein
MNVYGLEWKLHMQGCYLVSVWMRAWTNEPKGMFSGISYWHRQNINCHIGQNI